MGLRLERYSAMVQILSGSMTEDQVEPPFTPEEKETLASMRRDDEEYFRETGKHLIWDVPFGMFEEDYEMRKIAKSLYSEEYTIPDKN